MRPGDAVAGAFFVRQEPTRPWGANAIGDVILLMGHGSRDPEGAAEFFALAAAVREAAAAPVAAGVLEFASPGAPSIQEAAEACAASGAARVAAVPVLLLRGGHLRDDMPSQLRVARGRHPGVSFVLAPHLAGDERLLAIALDRAAEAERQAGGWRADTALLLVGRGSLVPEANGDLFDVAADLARQVGSRYRQVAACFVSLAPPGIAGGLLTCAAAGARRVVVVPYFINTGLLVHRIAAEARRAAAGLPAVQVLTARHMGVDPRLVALLVERAAEVTAETLAAGSPWP